MAKTQGRIVTASDRTQRFDPSGAYIRRWVTELTDVPTEQVQRIRAVEVQAHDPEAMAARWSEVLGITSGGTTVPLDEGEIRFVEVVDGRREGVSGLELAAARPDDFEIPGVRISLVAEHA